jgi:hypothetical protein
MGLLFIKGSERYALRDFTQQFAKVELKGSNYFLTWVYLSDRCWKFLQPDRFGSDS